ncbi:helix-turn-helix domain-containing protein [Longispora sp. K20-0274]|uniref:helix-turn-helix domain-containing protein n=1 Tax=Longispora sp. K20-0274 TaxID=3088255 RepID=UPI00399B710D
MLSSREHAIIALLAAGHTDASASVELDISVRTIAYTLSDLMGRLGVRNRFPARSGARLRCCLPGGERRRGVATGNPLPPGRVTGRIFDHGGPGSAGDATGRRAPVDEVGCFADRRPVVSHPDRMRAGHDRGSRSVTGAAPTRAPRRSWGSACGPSRTR